MKQIIKHLHQYIGCEMIWNRLDKTTVIPITTFGIHLIEIGDYKDIRIILKELDDISNDDFKELNIIRAEVYKTDEFGFDLESFKRLDDWSYLPAEIDFLRSKGFAIGIEKKYYTTEDYGSF